MDAVTAFGALVLDDAALQARLGAIDSPDAFVAEALALASAQGIALEAETVRAMIRPDPLGIGRWRPSPVTLPHWPRSGWLPARSVPTGAAPAFDWAWFGANRLDAPFFEESVRHFAARPFSTMFRTRTSLQALIDGVDDGEGAMGPDPSGFIHHMSRCGSTLVAQMLAADPAHVVLSEPEPLDAVLRWAIGSDAPIAPQVAAVRAVVAALGRGRTGASPLFVKLDSWHTAALPLLRAAFPRTPWIFLYRNPVEVLVSQMRQRGPHTLAGALPSDLVGLADGETIDPECYVARVVARFSQAVLEHWALGGGMLVDYAELPAAVTERIAPHFGLTLGARERAAMAAAALPDAKARDLPFVSDVAEKRQAASPAIHAAAQAIIGPAYDRLDVFRAISML
jgi:hypothetical protein